MATLWITEYRGPGRSGPAITQAPSLPEVAVQTVTIAGTSDASSALNPNTGLVRLAADAACHVAFGYTVGETDPAATTSSTPLAEGGEMFLDVDQFRQCKIAVIEAA